MKDRREEKVIFHIRGIDAVTTNKNVLKVVKKTVGKEEKSLSILVMRPAYWTAKL